MFSPLQRPVYTFVGGGSVLQTQNLSPRGGTITTDMHLWCRILSDADSIRPRHDVMQASAPEGVCTLLDRQPTHKLKHIEVGDGIMTSSDPPQGCMRGTPWSSPVLVAACCSPRGQGSSVWWHTRGVSDAGPITCFRQLLWQPIDPASGEQVSPQVHIPI